MLNSVVFTSNARHIHLGACVCMCVHISPLPTVNSSADNEQRIKKEHTSHIVDFLRRTESKRNGLIIKSLYTITHITCKSSTSILTNTTARPSPWSKVSASLSASRFLNHRWNSCRERRSTRSAVDRRRCSTGTIHAEHKWRYDAGRRGHAIRCPADGR
jgi:hypothetical protein